MKNVVLRLRAINNDSSDAGFSAAFLKSVRQVESFLCKEGSETKRKCGPGSSNSST